MALPQEVDREFLFQVLLARESLGSTGIGNGIAIPHVRNPITLHVDRPLVALCFLEYSIYFKAIDARPVHTLFTIVSPTRKAHLNLLLKLSFGLRNSEFAAAIAGDNHRFHSQMSGRVVGRVIHDPSDLPAGLRTDALAVSLIEGWRGEIYHVAGTDGAGRFDVYKVVDPSFHNWFGLALAMRGAQISDFPLCNMSFNLSFCGHDL